MNLFKSMDDFSLKDGEVKIYRGYFDQHDQSVFSDVNFEQNQIEMYGKTYFIPRLEAWFGEKDYTYTGMKLKSRPYPSWLNKMQREVQDLSDKSFNSALINKYRNGDDYVGYHSDDEACLGKSPVIASLSFGAERSFLLKHNTDSSSNLSIQLLHGDLLVMGAGIQEHYKHCVPKRKLINSVRYNITFRQVF
jgi:alkylated DNA repair dioxygenase AlkB